MNMTILNSILLQAQGGSGTMNLLMIVLIFVIFYFFMIRPQMKKASLLLDDASGLDVVAVKLGMGGLERGRPSQFFELGQCTFLQATWNGRTKRGWGFACRVPEGGALSAAGQADTEAARTFVLMTLIASPPFAG